MQPQSKLRAAIYARISETDERVDKVGNQEAECREHALRQGYDVVGFYVDDGVSAYKAVHRPGFEQLRADAAAGKFDVLIVVAPDRLSRRPQEMLTLSAVCAERSIKWDTVRDGLI